MTRPGTFKKGDDPRRNNRGRPPRKSMTAHLEEAMTDDARKKVAERLKSRAKAGDLAAIQFVYDRLEGRPKQAHEITGEDGGPVTFTIDINKQGGDDE